MIRLLAVALFVSAVCVFGVGRAHAATMNKAEAYAACMVEAERNITSVYDAYCEVNNPPPDDSAWSCRRVYTPNGGTTPVTCSDKFFFPYEPCPAGTEWNEWSKTCATPCSTRAPLDSGLTRSSGSMCSGGCLYDVTADNATTIDTNGGAVVVFSAVGAQPTGQTCQAGDLGVSDEPQLCAQLGAGQTACRKQNGDICYSASTGRQICWNPGETGEKTDADKLQKRNAGEEPIPPNTQLDNGDTLQQEGYPVTTSTSADGRTITTTTTNYGTTSGTNAGDSNDGEPGDGSGGGGEQDGEDEGPGAPSEGVGDLYEGDDRTVADVFGDFKTRIMAAPIMSAGTQFLTVTVSGTCPIFTVPATDYWDVLTFDYHCSGPLADALALGAFLLLAVAAYTAFKVAFY